MDTFGSLTETSPGMSQGCGGHVEHAHVAEAEVEQTVDEQRSPTPDVDDRLLLGRTERLQ
jgi:hypothetical protein